MYRKDRKQSRRPVLLNHELWNDLKLKKEFFLIPQTVENWKLKQSLKSSMPFFYFSLQKTEEQQLQKRSTVRWPSLGKEQAQNYLDKLRWNPVPLCASKRQLSNGISGISDIYAQVGILLTLHYRHISMCSWLCIARARSQLWMRTYSDT